ncbi:hypothetical protein Val02_58710 [Virgisporangium aliadipatigenens]|uniref:Uncharacterized protein n=1 Tax=Virgisporangium aliadipatigenens TaxID=741659 RepID=A0A8J4DS97_9ACTN|nr:hypothetical protein [Virgisporangium aliadipatigenens]GIJ48985.1 hypothetical protein Val02_58710 [Virgisporangium aliadipatigenens]
MTDIDLTIVRPAEGSEAFREAAPTLPAVATETVPHPVWSLRHVAVEGLGGHWCFAVRGRGPGYGAAGEVRFAFAPEEHPAAEVWVAGARAVAEEKLPDGEPDRRVLSDVLAALAMERPLLVVPGTPTAVAGVLRAVLSVLPRPVAAAWTWSTCALEESTTAPPLVTGQPLDGTHTVEATPDSGELHRFLKDARRINAFDDLVGHALTGTQHDLAEVIGRSAAPTLVALLDEIATELGSLTAEDVAGVLAAPTTAGLSRLQNRPDLVTTWAERHPADALRYLERDEVPTLRVAALAGLVSLQRTVADNVLGLPPADRPGWAEHLAALLTEFEPHRPNRVALMRELARPGGVLGDPERLGATHDWLRRLGLSPASEPELFPPRPGVVVADLDAEGLVSPRALAELRRAPKPARLLLDAATRARPMAPETAADVLAHAAALGATDLHEPAQALTQRATARRALVPAAGRRASARWLAALLDGLAAHGVPPESRRTALNGGLLALRARGGRDPLALPALREAGRELGLTDPEPAPSTSDGRLRGWLLRIGISALVLLLCALALFLSGAGRQHALAPPAGLPAAATKAPPATEVRATRKQQSTVDGPVSFTVVFESSFDADAAVAEFDRRVAGRGVAEVTLVGYGDSPLVARSRAEALRDLLRERRPAQFAAARVHPPRGRPADGHRLGSVEVTVRLA